MLSDFDLKGFHRLMVEKEVPCFIFMLENVKTRKPKFIEVIVKRPYRYTNPEILKRIPKKFKGVKVKVL